MNANDQLNRIFVKHWHDTAITSDDKTFSYKEVYAKAASISTWLERQGCRPGDGVALKLPNGWPLAITYLACLLGQYKLIPINPEISVDDQNYIVDRTQPKMVLDDPRLLADLHSLHCKQPAFNYPIGTVAAIFFTSGTTGRPKGVCHTLEAMVGNVVAFNSVHGLDTRTRLYHVLPMAYMAGFLNTLLSPWLAGGTVLLGPRFRPTDALQFWQRPLDWTANTIWLTPTIAALLARMNRDSLRARKVGSSLSKVFCGTAPLPETTRQAFRSVFGCSLQESYGMSEVLLVSAQTTEEAQQKMGVGQLLPGIRTSLCDNSNSKESELVIHTPWALKKYLLEEGESTPLLDDGGMPSGDVGVVKNGYLYITGRLKDLIIRGGMNVSPVAVEDVLLREHGILAAAIVGVPHDFWGEEIVACLIAKPGSDVDKLQNSLQDRCTRELVKSMRPDRFVWLDELPRSSTGKIQKHLLRGKLS